MNLEQHFATFLTREKLADSTLLLMVSGGVDSTVLLHVATQTHPQEKLHVLHVNHGLRDSAKDDELFVQKMCAEMGVSFYSEQLKEVPKKNTEATWRTERQARAEKLAQKPGTERILTAHHATDLVETMLYRLTTGCGIKGLAPFDTSTKPFWDVTKSDLISYAQEQKLTWCEDHTNADTTIPRNRIRHEVIPALRQINPNLEQTFVREAQTFQATADFIQSQLLFHSGLDPGSSEKSVTLKNFLTLPPILQSEFLREIAKRTPSADEVEDCLRWLRSKPQGGTKKQIGTTMLMLKDNTLQWKAPREE